MDSGSRRMCHRGWKDPERIGVRATMRRVKYYEILNSRSNTGYFFYRCSGSSEELLYLECTVWVKPLRTKEVRSSTRFSER